MRKITLAVLLSAILSPLTGHADKFKGRVQVVSDGDTVTLTKGIGKKKVKVRLLGIDCPEKNQRYGRSAKSSLARKILGKTVTIEWKKRGPYGRIIGKILYNGRDINLALVKEGSCWWYKRYARNQTRKDRNLYRNAELAARKKRIGLWASSNPTPPWEWRKKR